MKSWKKKFFFIAMITVIMLFLFSGCNEADNGDSPSGGSDSSSSGNSPTTNSFAGTLRATTMPAPGSTPEKPRIIDSYTNGTSNFYLIDVGVISDMYISTLAAVDYTGVPVDFKKTIATSEAYTSSLTNTVSESVAFSQTDGGKVGIGFEWKAKAGLFGFGSEFSVKGNFEHHWSNTNSVTNNKSTSDTSTTATQYAESQTVEYKMGSNTHPHGMYRYAIYGVADVYFMLETSLDNQTLKGWETIVCARPDAYRLRSEYTANRVFNNNPEETIDFEEDFYKKLPSLEVPPPPPPPSLPRIETDYVTIRNNSASYKINGNGVWFQYHDDINFLTRHGIDLNKLKADGYKTVSFHIILNVREYDDCTQYIYIYNSTAAPSGFLKGVTPPSGLNNLVASQTFYHTKGKKNTNWLDHHIHFNNLSIDHFTSRYVIRYSSTSGTFKDWANRNLRVKLIFE
ncbi:MAG: hypothetical protein FWD24_08220 [Treponema sp.]|nr:hypothetical protein [Treponema sp.]